MKKSHWYWCGYGYQEAHLAADPVLPPKPKPEIAKVYGQRSPIDWDQAA